MPGLSQTFSQVIAAYTAGGPSAEGALWTNLTRSEIASGLADEGFEVSVTVVDQLLEQHDFRRRKTEKSKTMGHDPDRDAQFRHIARLREKYLDAGDPVLSLDTKKREILGDFARAGRVWAKTPLKAWDHDFRSHATGVLVPQGVYDLGRNEGYVELGTSHDTTDFVFDALWGWWCLHGSRHYHRAARLLLMCDSGGSHSCRRWRFKELVQEFADATRLEVRVAHYPTYCSKYNPIEHRLFPVVTKAWKGVLLNSAQYAEQLLLARATTQTGLVTHTYIRTTDYPLGVHASDQFLAHITIRFDKLLPKWNYRALPRPSRN
jgi:hypothetical protein